MSASSDDDPGLSGGPEWYQSAIIYEVHVRAFSDSNTDGIGDFAGMVDRLDYLQDLGVTAIWLLPFYPSPLRDGGYDIADYRGVNPAYGTLPQFRRLLTEAHKRGIRIITELVLNHTSSDHCWFQRARKAKPGSKWRDFYVWSDAPDRYRDARIIFRDFESSNWAWDSLAGQYYWHRFYSHQPDLNYDNAKVHEAVFKVLDFWLDMGVDGVRLDAVPYLYQRDGTNCENLPETHAFLRKLRRHVDAKFPNRMLLAEANQWPEDAAAYFGAGDECHMNFHFPLMPRMFMGLHLEDSFPIIDILEQTPEIPASCQWALFLRNHDELTLEMVSDEDRDYMYRVYADDPQARVNLGIRRRLAPLLGVRRKVELMNGLLFSLPGTPVIYYGDEIGMGDNIYLGDRDGVRTPMQWSSDRNAGFSRANPQKLYLPVIIDPEYHYESLNVEAQQNNPSSLLWWMKRLIALRKQYPVFGSGSIEILRPDNAKVLCFVRSDGDQRVLVVANLSRFVQYVELEMGHYAGLTPVELFGRIEFPPLGAEPYFLSLGPHQFSWFALEPSKIPEVTGADDELATLESPQSWQRLLEGRPRERLAEVLVHWARGRRWFRGKGQRRRDAKVQETIRLETGEGVVAFVLLDVGYVEGGKDTYVVPVAFAGAEAARTLREQAPQAVIARVRVHGESPLDGVLYDALANEVLAAALLRRFSRRNTRSGAVGQLQFTPHRALRALSAGAGEEDLAPRLSSAEQTNTSIVYGERLILKVFRLLEQGVSPELEIGRHLTARARFAHTPELAGTIEYRRQGAEIATVAVLQRYVANATDAWEQALDSIDGYFERVLSRPANGAVPPQLANDLLERARGEPDATMQALVGPYLMHAELLGQRTAELHLALATDFGDPAFSAEGFSLLHQRSLYQSARSLLGKNLRLLQNSLKRGALEALGAAGLEQARGLLARRSEIDERLRRITERKLDAQRIRCHNDLHLGQVLFTGKDFVFIDFEGEPARPLKERSYKRSPLRDVSGMLRSFDYAAVSALRRGRVRPEDVEALGLWAQLWSGSVVGLYLQGYLQTAAAAPFLPPDDDLRILLDFYLLEKCIYELGYELNNRPNWLLVPLQGLDELLARGADE